MDKWDVGCEGNVGIDRRDQNLERDDGLYCHLLPSTLLRTSRSRTRSVEFIGTAVNICSDWTLSRIGSTQPCSKQLRYSYARCTLTPGGGRVMANLPRRRRAHRRSRHRRSSALPPPPAAIDTALCSQRHNAARPPKRWHLAPSPRPGSYGGQACVPGTLTALTTNSLLVPCYPM